jgi:hypothetical protein
MGLYSPTDLRYVPLFLLIDLAISVGVWAVFKFLIKNPRANWIKRILPVIVVLVMLSSETAKQIYSAANLYTNGNYYNVPLHVCSAPLFFFPLAVALPKKQGKSNIFMSAAVMLGAVITVGLLIYPNAIIGRATEKLFTENQNFMDTIHPFYYHMMIPLFVGLVLACGQYTPNKKHLWGVAAMFSGFMLLSLLLANIYGVDWARYLNYPIKSLDSEFAIWSGRGVIIWLLYTAIGVVGGLLFVYLPALLKQKRQNTNSMP